jgi:hypothetical protein
MLDLFMEPKFKYFVGNQFIPIFIVIVCSLILTHKTISPLRAATSIGILFYFSYFVHIFFHNLPDIFNIHINCHHDVESNKNIINRYINLFIEVATNVMFFVIFYFIQMALNIDFVPNIIIVYYAIIYISVHIVNYSLLHLAKSHVIHHQTTGEKKTCNYGPDYADHVFGTNYDDTFENYDHIIPNAIISFFITYYLYKPKI